jgi:hypothetical protein
VSRVHAVSRNGNARLVKIIILVVVDENRLEIWLILVIHAVNAINGSKQSLEYSGDGGYIVVAMDAGNVHGNRVMEAGGLNEFGVKGVNVVHYHY